MQQLALTAQLCDHALAMVAAVAAVTAGLWHVRGFRQRSLCSLRDCMRGPRPRELAVATKYAALAFHDDTQAGGEQTARAKGASPRKCGSTRGAHIARTDAEGREDESAVRERKREGWLSFYD